MGGAALGADLTGGAAADRARLAGHLRRDVRSDPRRAPRGRRGGRRGARARTDPVHARRPAAAQAGARRSRPRTSGWRWSSSRSPATTRFAVDRREIDRGGPSYTVDTLEDLRGRALAAGASTGSDADPLGRGVPRADDAGASRGASWSWHGSWSRHATGTRTPVRTFLAEHMPDLADRATFLDGPRLRLSASELRARAAAGRSLRYLVPDAVAAYIGDHALYQHSRRDPPS